MDLKRFFCDSVCDGKTARLIGDEFYHAAVVTRHKIGYKVIVCDGTPYDYYGTITEISNDCITVSIDKIEPNDTENSFKTSLFIGNNKSLDDVIQKAVEMGVTEITPFLSQHCNVKDFNIARMRKIILESSKQCGRSSLAVINPPITFEKMISLLKPANTFAFYEYERVLRVQDTTIADPSFVQIVIGCEGGFSISEIECMKEYGIRTYSLGKRILRVPTAVVAACALVNERLGAI